VPLIAVSPERNSTGMDKIMETLDSVGIKLLLLGALKALSCEFFSFIFFFVLFRSVCLRCVVPVSVH
jgi:hypothetical protein